MIRVTSHVLDLSAGRPAPGVRVRLERRATGPEPETVGTAVTDADGRVRDWLPGGIAPGRYRLVFETGDYLRAQGRETIYPEIAIEVELREEGRHYHLPLLLAPHGYTAYRGS
jgi:5-hydroxyisourate hydrolase